MKVLTCRMNFVLQYFVFDFIGPQLHLFDKIIKISVSISLVVMVMEVGEILGFGKS